MTQWIFNKPVAVYFNTKCGQQDSVCLSAEFVHPSGHGHLHFFCWRKQNKFTEIEMLFFLISNFRRFLNIVRFILADSPASEF
jgi:hypothetical protein